MNLTIEQKIFINNAQAILQKKGYRVDYDHYFNGCFGFVFFVVDEDDSELAAKVISLNNYEEDRQNKLKLLSSSQQEAQLLQDHVHQNIITYISHFIEGNYFFLLMERAIMNLDTYAKNNYQINPITEEEFFEFAGQMIDAIEYLHNQKVILRDFKLDNILMCQNQQLKVCDFGLSRKFYSQQEMSQYQQEKLKGSYFILPPETMNIEIGNQQANIIKQTTKGDIWALGISLYVLIGANSQDCISLSWGQVQQKDFHKSPIVNKFINQILVSDFNQRPSIQEVKNILCNISNRYKSNCLVKEANFIKKKYEDFEETERILKTALQIDPQNSRIYSLLGFLQLSNTDKSKSLEYAKQALKLNEKNQEAILLWFFAENDQSKQDKLIQDAISLNKYSSSAFNCAGYNFFKQNKYQDAIKQYKLAIKFNKNFGVAYYNIGLVHQMKKEYDKAILCYLQAKGRDISDGLSSKTIGQIYIYNLKQIPIGEQFLELAVRESSKLNHYKEALLQHYFEQSKYNEASQVLQLLIKSSPNQQLYRLKLIKALCYLNRFQEAEEQASISAQQFKTGQGFYLLAETSKDLRKKEYLIKGIEKTIEIDFNSENYQIFAKWCEEFGENRRALDLYTQSFNFFGSGEKDIKRLTKLLKIN